MTKAELLKLLDGVDDNSEIRIFYPHCDSVIDLVDMVKTVPLYRDTLEYITKCARFEAIMKSSITQQLPMDSEELWLPGNDTISEIAEKIYETQGWKLYDEDAIILARTDLNFRTNHEFIYVTVLECKLEQVSKLANDWSVKPR